MIWLENRRWMRLLMAVEKVFIAGWWSDIPQVRAALRINVLFLIGVAIAPILFWAFRTTRWGLLIRTAGESSDAARAMGYSVLAIRLRATMVGGFLAGIGGSFLSLFYPGSWNEGLSSGQGGLEHPPAMVQGGLPR